MPPKVQARRSDGNGGRMPQGLETLPEDVPESEWKLWPRKDEAHLIWQVRERAILSKCTQHQICQYMCPDTSIRLDPEELRAIFGEPGEFLAKANRAKKGGDAEAPSVNPDDPLPEILQQVLGILRDTREDSRAVLKLVLDPANQHMQNLLTANAAQAARITELEGVIRADWERQREDRYVERLFEREERQGQALERRRDEIMGMLRGQLKTLLPKLMGTAGSVAEFIDGIDPMAIQALIESGLLPPDKVVQLKTLLELKKHSPAPGAAPTNGAPAQKVEPS
jgi:hypothetical protein